MGIEEEPALKNNRVVRAHIVVRGIVQGVGFRPFVHRIARARQMAGWVLNSTEGVEIEVEGPIGMVDEFVEDLSSKAPPLAGIHRIDVHLLPPAGYPSFAIEDSQDVASGFPLISPDVATCSDCLAELLDPDDRRYRYPFINCTNCGPRFTIVEAVPYDRPRTTMKAFAMCPDCQNEYDDPSNRRFHAQPDACPVCGPSLKLLPEETSSTVDHVSDALTPDAIEEARRLLKSGRVLAVKGIGGFHLACDATNVDAVRTLRARKRRVEKPFAIMVRDLEAAGGICHVDEAEARLLTSARRPIVLLNRRDEAGVVPEVAPRNKRLGVMLPYTPIHHLLLEPTEGIRFEALVMTSGNLAEEPIARDDDEALSRLASLADYFLVHDRPIRVRCDDSVTQVFRGKETVLRRSRGYAPLPVRLALQLEPVLACGAELKNTFCIGRDNYALLSQHIGDLDNQETLDFFADSIDHFVRVFKLNPRLVAHDLHPDYLSTRYALSTGLAAIPVQHHHAHVASCMAENGLNGRVVGVAFDGTGYGPDGTIWGGEFLLAAFRGFERAAHLKCVPLPGGEAAIKRPFRIALSYLIDSYGEDLPEIGSLTDLDPVEVQIVKRQVARGVNSPMTSSCGRLFDAVSSLLGIRGEVSYEGQAAIELEMAAKEGVADTYRFELSQRVPLEIDASPVVRSIVADLRRGEERRVIAARFHNGVARMIVEVCEAIRRATGLNDVCLSGGVFQNRVLLSRTIDALRRSGFETYTHHQVPCNDGGISLGQAAVASAKSRADSA